MPGCACLTMVEAQMGISSAHIVIHDACCSFSAGYQPRPQEDLSCIDQECLFGAQSSQPVWVDVTV